MNIQYYIYVNYHDGTGNTLERVEDTFKEMQKVVKQFRKVMHISHSKAHVKVVLEFTK